MNNKNKLYVLEDDLVLMKRILTYSIKADRDSILAIEADANADKNLFLSKGLSFAVDGLHPSFLEDTLYNIKKYNLLLIENDKYTETSRQMEVIIRSVMFIYDNTDHKYIEAYLNSMYQNKYTELITNDNINHYIYELENDEKLIYRLIDYAIITRRQGPVASKDLIDDEDNLFIKNAFKIIISDFDRKDILDYFLSNEIQNNIYKVDRIKDYPRSKKLNIIRQMDVISDAIKQIVLGNAPRYIEYRLLDRYPEKNYCSRFD